MNYLQTLVSDPAAWVALLTLIAMEVVGRAITHFTPALVPACGWMREARRSQ